MSRSILLSAQRIKDAIDVVSSVISDYEPEAAMVVPTAAFIFAADLLRASGLRVPVYMTLVKSYDPASGFEVVQNRPFPSGKYKRVLLIESCLDSGKSILLHQRFLQAHGVDVVCRAVAVDKAQPKAKAKADVCLIRMSDKLAATNPFIYGYGMDDANGEMRGLPYIAFDASPELK